MMLAAGFAAVTMLFALRPYPGTRCRRIFAEPVGAAAARRPGPPLPLLGAAAVGVACLVLFGLPAGLLLAGGAVPLAAHLFARLETNGSRRRRLELARQLPGAVDLLVSVVAAGRPPADAFALVGQATAEPLGSEFVLIASRLAIAGDEQAVWEGLRRRPQFAALGRCFARASRSGMPIAKVLERLAEDLRRDYWAVTQQRARSVAVATAAPLGLCFLPAFFLIGIMPALIGAFSTFRW